MAYMGGGTGEACACGRQAIGREHRRLDHVPAVSQLFLLRKLAPGHLGATALLLQDGIRLRHLRAEADLPHGGRAHEPRLALPLHGPPQTLTPCTNRQFGCLRSVVAWCAQASSASSLVRGTVIIGLGHGLTSGIQSLTGSDFAPPAVCAPPLPRLCTRPGSRGYKGLTRRCLLAAGHDSVPRSVHVSDAGRGFREPAAAGEAGAGRICRHGDARGRRPRPCLRHDLPPARA